MAGGGKKFFNNKKRNFEKQTRDKDDEGKEGKKDNRPSWLKLDREERHVGSYNYDELIQSPEYLNYKDKRINPDNATKKKYALCFSYLGTNYQGLQINPDAKSIEREIERALFLTGAIIDSNFGFLQKVQWTRAARTDRGVHALTQCIAARLLQPKDESYNFIQEVNNFLPPDIRLQYMMRTTKAFNSKAQCTKRSYHYLLPTFAFQSPAILNKILSKLYEEQGPIVGAGYEGGYVDPKSSKSLNFESLVKIRDDLVKFRLEDYDKNVLNKEKDYTINKFDKILKNYCGTRNYHNFTSGKDSSETNSNRYILHFKCQDLFVDPSTNVEWLRLEVLGQSFLLNQIRKMVGFALELTRDTENVLTEELFEKVFDPKLRIDIPIAPALGLYLNELYFEGYNNKIVKENEKMRLSKEKKKKESEEKNENNEESNENKDESKENKEESNENKEENEEEDGVCKEINFYGVPEVKESIINFRDNILTPHILKQEYETLSFLYYFDYLRVHKHTYEAKNKKEEKNENKEEKKNEEDNEE